MRLLLAVPALLSLTSIALANNQQASGKTASRPPWEWTLEERIRDRSDPVKAEKRVVAARSARPSGMRIQATNAGTNLQGDVIDGRRDPELFLPIELFQIFVSGAFTEDATGRAVYREGCIQDSSVQLPPNFWSRIDEITVTYVTTLNRARAINRQAGAAEEAERERLNRQSQEIQARQCQRLAENLESARRAFGRQFFDRFLYEAVAPTSGIALQRPNTPSEMLQFERGCR